MIRGRTNSFDVNGRSIAPQNSRGIVSWIAPAQNGTAIAQPLAVTYWDNTWKNTATIDLSSLCTGMVEDGDGFAISTYRDGIFHWKPGGKLEPICQRGSMLSAVCKAGRALVILWADGWLKIGTETIVIPRPIAGGWYGIAATETQILLGGQEGDGAVLMLLTKQANGTWRINPVEHKVLDELNEADWLAISGDHIAVTAPNGTIEMTLSSLDINSETPTSTIEHVSAGTLDTNKTSFRTLLASDQRLVLTPNEDEIKFALKGGPAYWNFRARISYRITPGSDDWNDVDATREVRVQRVGFGNHALELRQHSVFGDSISRYTIIRPPF